MNVHELAICQGLIRAVDDLAARNGAGRVRSVQLEIGPLSGVEAPLLERAWSVARLGTIAEEAPLKVTLMPIIVRCAECEHQGEARINRLLCPACGSWRVTILSGGELRLTSIDIDDAAENQLA